MHCSSQQDLLKQGVLANLLMLSAAEVLAEEPKFDMYGEPFLSLGQA